MRNELGEKKSAFADWHPADIVAAVRKAGTSLSRLSLQHGYEHKQTLQKVLRKPWPKGERVVAAAIGLRPQAIWPSRYDEAGRPNRRHGRPSKKHSSSEARA